MMGGRTCVAAVLLLALTAGAPQAQAQRLGRLFTTPEQRAVLDEIRAQAQFEQPQLEPDSEPASAASLSAVPAQPSGPSIANLTINGVVRRRGGRTTVWVNGHEVDRGDVSREGVLVESAPQRSGAVRLRLPSGTESIALRPGQKIDISTGTVLEAYERGNGSSAKSAFASAPTPVAAQAPMPQINPQEETSDAGVTRGSTDSPQLPLVNTNAPSLSIEQLRAISQLPPDQQAEALSEFAVKKRRTDASQRQ